MFKENIKESDVDLNPLLIHDGNFINHTLFKVAYIIIYNCLYVYGGFY